MRETRTPLALCPECGYAFDAATHIGGRARPSPGDLSICLSCGTLLLFDDDLRPVVRAAAGVVDELPERQRAQVLASIDHIQRRGRLGSGAVR
jgi:hypothetical protein